MKLLTFWRRNRYAVLGYIAAAIPSLKVIEGLIPSGHMKWWDAAAILAGLAIARTGHTISKQEPKS